MTMGDLVFTPLPGKVWLRHTNASRHGRIFIPDHRQGAERLQIGIVESCGEETVERKPRKPWAPGRNGAAQPDDDLIKAIAAGQGPAATNRPYVVTGPAPLKKGDVVLYRRSSEWDGVLPRALRMTHALSRLRWVEMVLDDVGDPTGLYWDPVRGLSRVAA